jgi:hypothetical protein
MCSNSLTSKRNTPDEFMIQTKNLLSIPPEYDLIDPKSNVKASTYNKINIDGKSTRTNGEQLLLENILNNYNNFNIDNNKNIIEPKNFLKKLFNKDATESPAAIEKERTYKSKSMQIMKENISQDNQRICDIENGEIIYCNKNKIMKNFSFSPNQKF